MVNRLAAVKGCCDSTLWFVCVSSPLSLPLSPSSSLPVSLPYFPVLRALTSWTYTSRVGWLLSWLLTPVLGLVSVGIVANQYQVNPAFLRIAMARSAWQRRCLNWARAREE